MGDLTAQLIDTPRLRQNVWTGGPDDGAPVLLVHGNLTTGGFWRYVADHLPGDARVIAPDLRGFGDTDPEPIDATRGLGDMVDDVRALLETLTFTGGRRVHAVGWSMGGGMLEQYLLTYPDEFASLTLIAPLSPYGFGGTKGASGELVSPDGAGSGAGGANPDFVRRLAERDAGTEDPMSAPRTILSTFFGPRGNAENVDEEFLLAEMLKTRTGDDFYPGNGAASPHWPNAAPGNRGVLNAMAPTHFNAAGLAAAADLPPITWVRCLEDQVVSDESMFDLATLGKFGAIPDWPGAEVMPPQPMEAQLRAVLDASGAEWTEVVLDGIAHGAPLETPAKIAEIISERIRG